MAWISIREQVMGGKLRNLAKAIGCSQNEALGILVRLWLWGINNAKKDGEIIGADKEDIADVLTVGLEKKILPKKVVDALIETNWIDYKGNYYIHDWSEWQGQWYKALESREKATERKRKERARKGNEQLAPEIETKERPFPERGTPLRFCCWTQSCNSSVKLQLSSRMMSSAVMRVAAIMIIQVDLKPFGRLILERPVREKRIRNIRRD